MIEPAPSFPDVVRGNPDDAEFIIQWLKIDWDKGGGHTGFYGNREIIRKSAGERGDLWVVRRDGEAIAFQVGDYAADIVEVREDHRRTGLGKLLFDASAERAMRDNITVLSGECSPKSSLSFWEHMGFQRYDDPRRPRQVFVRKIIDREFDLPTDAQRLPVTISFLSETALYRGGDDSVVPIITHRIEGAVMDDGSVLLDRRIVGFRGDLPDDRDLAIKIDVDGEQRCFGKAKHDEAVEAGVVWDSKSDAFYIDIIRPQQTEA